MFFFWGLLSRMDSHFGSLFHISSSDSMLKDANSSAEINLSVLPSFISVQGSFVQVATRAIVNLMVAEKFLKQTRFWGSETHDFFLIKEQETKMVTVNPDKCIFITAAAPPQAPHWSTRPHAPFPPSVQLTACHVILSLLLLLLLLFFLPLLTW